MNFSHLNDPVSFRAWLDGLQYNIYMMTQEQLIDFQAKMEIAMSRRNRNDLMTTRKAETEQGLFVQIDAQEGEWTVIPEEEKREVIEQN
jgi:hypothetical protein